MPNTLQIKRRTAGGTPGIAGVSLAAGELAVNFAGATAGDTLPALYVGDGSTNHILMSQADRLSQRVLTAPSGTPSNDQGKVPVLDATGKIPSGFYTQGSVTITSKTIPGTGTPAADGNAVPAGTGWPWVVGASDVPVVTHDGSAYIFTGGAGSYGTAAGGTALTAAMFTPLGSATTAATDAEVKAGTATASFLTPKGLAAVLPPATLTAGVTGTSATGVAGDANKLVTLDANGKIPTALIPVSGLTFKSADLTAAPPTGGTAIARQNGVVIVNNAAASGAIDAGWSIAGNPSVDPGDMLLDDGTVYHLIESTIDLSDAVSRTKANAATDAFSLTMAVPAAAGLMTRIDGTDKAKSRLQNFTFDSVVVDAGTF